MKTYTVYFEIFGKKMKTTELATTKEQAKQNIINKIKWHKIVNEPDNNILDQLNDIVAGRV